jgi:hypothetical protein
MHSKSDRNSAISSTKRSPLAGLRLEILDIGIPKTPQRFAHSALWR